MESSDTSKESEALAALRAASIPRLRAEQWTSSGAKAGLSEIARLRASLAVAQAVLVGVMATESGRDTTAALSRRTGMSGREAREATKTAEVILNLPGAEEALAAGQVTPAHLAALAPLASTADAPDLLELAARQSPEEFARTVQRARIERDGKTWSEKQHAARSVKFFNDEYGCIGMRAVLPPLAGTIVKNTLNNMANEAWRAAHPDRARTLGGHDAEPFDRRLADAPMALVGAQSKAGSSAVTTTAAVSAKTAAAASSPGDASTTNADDLCAHKPGDDNTSVVPGRTPENATATTAARSGTMVGRPTVVVTINAETLESEIVGVGPIPFTEAAALAATADLYAAVHSSTWAILNFGRNRRLASPLQRLAAIVRDGGCIADGCTASYDRCDLQHEPPWEDGGCTNLDALEFVCSAEHHSHRHATGTPLRRRSPPLVRTPRPVAPTRTDGTLSFESDDLREDVDRSGVRENAEIDVCPWTDEYVDAEFAALTDEAWPSHLPDISHRPDEELGHTKIVGRRYLSTTPSGDAFTGVQLQ